MNFGIEGRVALVSGASRGIGKAIAIALAAEGAKVGVGFREASAEALDIVKQIESHGGDAMAIRLDITSPVSCRAAVEHVTTAWGAIEILVNNGGAFPQPGPFAALSDEGWADAIRNQLEGPGNLIRAVLPSMSTTGWGRIVNISSVHALIGNPGVVAHTSAKSGLHGLTKSLAKEIGKQGILVNTVLPGLTTTEDVLTRFPPDHLAKSAEAIPSGHPSRPEDIAALVLFLASSANGNVTGELVKSAGGL